MSTLAYFELNTVKLFVLLVLVGGSKQHINPGECLCSTVEAVRYSRRGGGGVGLCINVCKVCTVYRNLFKNLAGWNLE